MTAEEYFKKYGRFPTVPSGADEGAGQETSVPSAPKPAGTVTSNYMADRPLMTGIPAAPSKPSAVATPPQTATIAPAPQAPDKWGQYHAAVNRDAEAYGLKAPAGMSAREFGLRNRAQSGAIAPQYREAARSELDGMDRRYMASQIPSKPVDPTIIPEGAAAVIPGMGMVRNDRIPSIPEGGMAVVPGMGMVRNERKFQPQPADSPWTSTSDGKILFNKTTGERQEIDKSGKTVILASDQILVDEGSGRVLAKNLKDMDFSDGANMARNITSIMKNYMYLTEPMQKKVDEYLKTNMLDKKPTSGSNGGATIVGGGAASGAIPIWQNPKRRK